MEKRMFLQALEHHSLIELEKIPKSDLHNHAGRGGALSYLHKKWGIPSEPPDRPFHSLHEMNAWLQDHVKCYFPDGSGYLPRIEAAFAQAEKDSIRVLALSFTLDEIYFLGGINSFIDCMDRLLHTYAPNTCFLPDLALGYKKTDETERLDEILGAHWFCGIDICNYSHTYSISELKGVCRKAKNNGLILKAHVGEFGNPDEILQYAQELNLDQIQHGIAAAQSPHVMKWLADHKVQLNICPTSNVMLKSSRSYSTHPIRVLFDYGIPVTINTDDLLIFQATVSQEYLNLYQSGVLTGEELNIIRQTGLKY